jgi:hypothetical protein
MFILCSNFFQLLLDMLCHNNTSTTTTSTTTTTTSIDIDNNTSLRLKYCVMIKDIQIELNTMINSDNVLLRNNIIHTETCRPHVPNIPHSKSQCEFKNMSGKISLIKFQFIRNLFQLAQNLQN